MRNPRSRLLITGFAAAGLMGAGAFAVHGGVGTALAAMASVPATSPPKAPAAETPETPVASEPADAPEAPGAPEVGHTDPPGADNQFEGQQ